MTLEFQFLTAEKAKLFEAEIAALGAQLISAPRGSAPNNRWTVISPIIMKHARGLQTIHFNPFDMIKAVWSYQTGARKVYVNV